MVEYQRKMARGHVFTGLSVSAGTPIHRYLSTLHSSRNIINIGIKSYTSATSSNVASRQKHIFLLGQLVRLMPKQVKPLTELAVENLRPNQKPDGTLLKTWCSSVAARISMAAQNQAAQGRGYYACSLARGDLKSA